jgi:hypothetical protein
MLYTVTVTVLHSIFLLQTGLSQHWCSIRLRCISYVLGSYVLNPVSVFYALQIVRL